MMKNILIVLLSSLVLPLFVFGQGGRVQMVIGANHVATYEQRAQWIRGLGALTEADQRALIEFLGKPLIDSRMTEGQLATLKNDVADNLLASTTLGDLLHQVLLKGLLQKDQGTVWPSYILQKLPTIILQLGETPEREKTLAALWGIATDSQHPEGATGLIALNQLAEKTELIDRAQFSELLLEIAQDPEAYLVNRTTALELAGSTRLSESRQIATDILNSYQSAPLKVAAIAVFSYQGKQADEALLTKFIRSQDIRVRSAAIHAIKQIRLRG